MPNFLGPKWGDQTFGTPGGVVTWSYAEVLPEDDGTICSCTIVIDPDNWQPPTYNDIDREPEILLALQNWSLFGDIDFVKIASQQDAPKNKPADIRFHFDGTSDDGDLSVEFVPDDSNGGLGGDVYISAPYYPGSRSAPIYDLDLDLFRGLLLREIGNALGLGAVADNSVMTDDVTFSELQDDDKLGISQIYGSQGGDPTVYTVKGKTPFRFWNAPDDLIVEGDGQSNVISGDAQMIFGLGGSDRLTGGGSDVFGGDGRDKIAGYGGDNKLYGENGWDTITSHNGNDEIYGGAGKDTIIVTGGDNYVDGGSNYDTVDFRDFTWGAEVLATMVDQGQDHSAIVGNVLVNVEKVIAGDRDSQIFGNSSDNKIIGWNQDDTLHGNAGNDTIYGKDRNDEIDGGAGNDSLRGDDGNDTLNGGDGNDRLEGNAYNDQLFGDAGNDTLSGGSDYDHLLGGAGNDKLNGGSDRDTLDGGAGNDILIGSRGADQFVFADDHGKDRIKDFNFRSDDERIDLRAVADFDSFQDVRDAARNTFKGVVIETGADSWIRLDGVRLGQLDADDFLF